MDRILNYCVRSVCLLFVLMILPHCLVRAAINERNSAEYYRSEYGVISPSQNSRVAYAEQVFKQLVTGTKASDLKKLRLIILPRTAANWENWAMSLPDGTILLVENVLELCFENKPIPGDKELARLAFILSHEIAHLLNHHHQQLALKNALPFYQVSTDESQKLRKHLESGADYSGIIRMTMAGYDPGYLLDRSNFFQDYIEKVRFPANYRGHESPDVRLRSLKQQLQPLIAKIPLFSDGLRFYKNGEFRKAALHFEEFSKLYPGREVFNNIALCNYQLALMALSKEDGRDLFRFMLSTTVDETTLAVKLLPEDLSHPKSLNSDFKQHLELTLEHLNRAIKLDPDYLPAKINQSSALILKQSYEEALALLNEALKTDPTNVDALNNKAIAFYLINPSQNSELSLKMLDLLSAESGHYTQRFARYNASRIRFEQMKCVDSKIEEISKDCLRIARKSWSGFLNSEPGSSYAQFVRLELGAGHQPEIKRVENHRLALVIGNSLYYDRPLLNPQFDAMAMENVLKRLGFEIVSGVNLTKPELLEKIQSFGKRLTPTSTGLVFYSGHGFQIKGENFLLPVHSLLDLDPSTKTPVEMERRMRDLAVSLNVILNELEDAQNVQNIIMLDACRDNPFPGFEGNTQGFAEMSAPPRTFIAYSTSPGKLAWDGLKGKHGVFTDALLKQIEKPNTDIYELFQSVRKEVAETTSGYQVSWDVSTLDESFYFNPPKSQDWKWHITAGAIALVAGWQSREEARNYRQLNEENELLLQAYGSAINLVDYYDIRQTYYINQERMKTHKRNYELLDFVTMAAVLWEIYLLTFKTYDEGIYPSSIDNPESDFVFFPVQQTNQYGVSMQWRW